MNRIWSEIWSISLGLNTSDAEIISGLPNVATWISHVNGDHTIEPVESHTNALTQIRNEIFVISLGSSTSAEVLIQGKQEASKDRRVLKPNATTSISHHLTTEDIERLQPLRWFNDDLITFGICMIQHKFIIPHRISAFSTYFLEKIRRDGLDAIRKWHARIEDPLSKDILLFPVHINGNHWYLQVVIVHPLGCSTVKNASLFILDSLGCKADHKIHADVILLYLRQYWPHLKIVSVRSSKVPQQDNTSDCGVYVIYFSRVLCMRDLQMSLRVLEGDSHLNNEDISMYWDIREASKIRSWLLQCAEECVP